MASVILSSGTSQGPMEVRGCVEQGPSEPVVERPRYCRFRLAQDAPIKNDTFAFDCFAAAVRVPPRPQLDSAKLWIGSKNLP
jgi:hypothetical protein